MYTIVLVSLIAVLILISSNQAKTKQNLLPGVIVLLSLFFGIRDHFGNDYAAYSHVFEEVNSRSDRYIFNSYLGDIEIGWIYLNKLFKPLGFEAMVMFLTFFQFGVIGWFIMKMVPRKYQWQALALYMFMPGFMVTQLSMMRQSVAMSFMMLALPFVVDKKFIKAAVLVSVGLLFHKSAFAAFLLFPLIYCVKVNYKWVLLVYVVILFICQFFPQPIVDVVELLSTYKQYGKYEYYMKESNMVVEMRSGLGFIFQLIMSIYIGYLLKFRSTKFRYFILCMLLGYAFTPITGTIGMAARILIYYQQAGILGFLPLFKRAKKDAFALVLTIVFMAYIASAIYIFFTSEVYVKRFFYYHTLLE
ncbi:MAG: EpsG family protein [Muribaculaceae bacterium]|nr:EpsG family protein [Muribaculaceae bacterium]